MLVDIQQIRIRLVSNLINTYALYLLYHNYDLVYDCIKKRYIVISSKYSGSDKAKPLYHKIDKEKIR